MEEVILTDSFKKKAKINLIKYENNTFEFEIKNSLNSIIETNVLNGANIKRIDMQYGRCPRPGIRNIPLFIELFTAVLLVIALINMTNKVLSITFGILSLVCLIVAAIISKILYKKAPEAIDIIFYTKNKKKYYFFASNVSSQTYKTLSKMIKDVKKNYKEIVLNLNTRK